MPRQRTKGESIAFRLPVHKDAILNTRAAEAGMTARDFAAMIVEQYLDSNSHSSPSAAQGVVDRRPGAAIAKEFFSS